MGPREGYTIGSTLRLVGCLLTAALVLATLPGRPAAGTGSAGGLVIDTFAGTGDPGNAGDGGPARHAEIAAPGDVATAPDGTVYIVTGLTIRAVDPKTGRISTVAGTGKAGFSGDGGPATKARFSGENGDNIYGLSGIDVGPDGTLYIADAGNHRIRAVDPDDGTIKTVAGNGAGKDDRHFTGDGGPARKAELHYPRDVAVADDGTIYVADALNYRVRAIDPKTKRISTVAGERHPGDEGSGFFPEPEGGGKKASNTFVEPSAVEVHDGLVYVAENEDDRVRVVDPGKDTIRTAVGRGSTTSYLANPTDLTIHAGTLYIAANDVFSTDTSENRVYAFDLEKKRLSRFAGGAKGPALGDGGAPEDAVIGGPEPGGVMGIAAGPEGAVYIADATYHRVRVVREGDPSARSPGHPLSDERITTLLGSGKRWTEQAMEEQDDEEDGAFYRDVHQLDEVDLDEPSSVAVARDGTVYVADTENDRIRVLEPGDDTVRTLAGRPDLPDADEGNGDGGEATDAFLDTPRGLVLGPDRKLYFTDTDTYNDDVRVRYVDLEEGTVHTVPGSKYQLDTPVDLALDREGTLYVADSGNGRVCRLRPGAEKCVTIVGDDDEAGSVSRPVGVAFGPDGTLYVADAGSFRVRAHDLRTGAERTVAGMFARGGLSGDGGPATSAQIGAPAGIHVGSDGTLYITDQANHRVRAVHPKTGVITTVAGNGHFDQTTQEAGFGGGGYSGDGGAAGKAELNSPADVEVGPDGLLYIADTGNNRIRVVGDADVTARGGVGPLPFVVGAVLALAALAAAFLYLRRRRRRAVTAA